MVYKQLHVQHDGHPQTFSLLVCLHFQQLADTFFQSDLQWQHNIILSD